MNYDSFLAINHSPSHNQKNHSLDTPRKIAAIIIESSAFKSSHRASTSRSPANTRRIAATNCLQPFSKSYTYSDTCLQPVDSILRSKSWHLVDTYIFIYYYEHIVVMELRYEI
jgi:hypothetical protein